MQLPVFKYHPNPVETGSFEVSKAQCRCCGQARGYIYTGPAFAEEALFGCICPWCIANGDAHEKFDAEFTDYDGIGDCGMWDEVQDAVKEEIAYRTPGFSGWQQEKWWTHCGDGAMFLGQAGKTEILQYGGTLVAALKEESGCDDEQWAEYLEAMSKEESPSAYVFQCCHCGALGGYSDCD